MKIKEKRTKITKVQGVAYAKVALHFLKAMKIEITEKNLEEQMWLVYDLYENFEIIKEGNKY